MVYALLAVCAYMLGSIPFGVLVARAKGVDIMAVGSRNTGATNVARTLGWGLGSFVFALDVLKGVVPALVAKSVTGSDDAAVLIGVAAVLGHTLSPFLGFKGGKGVATGLGVLVGSAPLVGGVAFAVFLLLFAITRIVSVSSLVAAIVVLVAAWFTKQSAVFFAVFTPLVAYVFYRHRANIGRLLKGEEPRFKKKDKNDG